MHVVVDIDCRIFLQLADSSVTHGHQLKLCKSLCASAIIASTFNTWNALPADIVSATSLDMFTARLNSIDSSRLLSSFKMYFHAIVFSAFRVRVRVFQ